MSLINVWNDPPQHLNELKWKNRILLLFGPKDGDAELRRQEDELRSHDKDFTDRDVVVFTVSREDALRQKYRISLDGYTLILLGKDGTEKLRRHSVVPAKEILELIDSMPMRRAGER